MPDTQKVVPGGTQEKEGKRYCRLGMAVSSATTTSRSQKIIRILHLWSMKTPLRDMMKELEVKKYAYIWHTVRVCSAQVKKAPSHQQLRIFVHFQLADSRTHSSGLVQLSYTQMSVPSILWTIGPFELEDPVLRSGGGMWRATGSLVA